MLDGESVETNSTPGTTEIQPSVRSDEAAPVMPQTATAEHANVFRKVIARIQSVLSGKREAASATNTQLPASASQGEAPQPLTPPTPGTPTT